MLMLRQKRYLRETIMDLDQIFLDSSCISLSSTVMGPNAALGHLQRKISSTVDAFLPPPLT